MKKRSILLSNQKKNKSVSFLLLTNLLYEEKCNMKEKFFEKNYALQRLQEYEQEMRLQELSERTINKYIADIIQWLESEDSVIEKENIIVYKSYLCGKYAVTSANSKIVSVNRYLRWMGFSELTVKTNRLQSQNGLENMITKECYLKMLYYASAHNKNYINYSF